MKQKKIGYKKDQKKDEKKYTGFPKIGTTKWLVPLIIASFVLNIIFITIAFLPKDNLIKNLEYSASKGAFTILNPKKITDPERKSFSILFAELWENRLQRMNGYICEFPLHNFPSCSLIVDGELKIVSIGSLNDLILSGKEIYQGAYFSKFFGLGIENLAGNSGIFKPDEEEQSVYAEQFKVSLLKAMKLLFIKVKGENEFNRLFPNGMNLAAVGDYLQKFSAVDSTGTNLTIQDLQKKKNALISVDVGCGACQSKCALMRDLLSSGDVNVIFIADGTEEESKSFLDNYVHGEKVIFDPELKVTNLLYMGDAPYLMLIDRDLKIHFKDSINEVAKDAEPAINAFIK